MAQYTKSSEWWSARRGTRPAARSAFGDAAGTFTQIARDGELVYLTHPMTVFYNWGLGTNWSRELPAGAVRCTKENFGATFGSSYGCGVRTSELGQYLETKPTIATKLADEGQGFRVDTAGHVYYVPDYNRTGLSQGIRQFVLPGSFMCNNQHFGPDPAFGKPKQCWFVPAPGSDVVEAGAPITYYDELASQYEAMQRAEVAAQAQRDMVAAQDRVFADRQAADYAAQQAQIAQNAQAQEAAALAAAEMYRQAQQAAQQQAAQYAAELAALAAANATDIDAAMAAAEMAAQAEALRQALAQAQAHEAEQRAAYDMANAATQAEMRNQEQANARLDAAENAADQAAANAAAGGAASPFANLTTTEMLMYGGIAAAAIYLLMDEKKA